MLHKTRGNYFLNKVVKDWNKLPSYWPWEMITTNVDDFKNKFDQLEQFHFLV